MGGRIIHSFNRFLATNLDPYLDSKNYRDVSKLSPMSMNKLVLLDIWARLQINLIHSEELIKFIEIESRDTIDLILLYIDKGDTIL